MKLSDSIKKQGKDSSRQLTKEDGQKKKKAQKLDNIKMAKTFKITDNSKHWPGYRGTNAVIHYCRNAKCTTTLEKILVVSYKVKNTFTIQPSNPILQNSPRRNENVCFPKDLYKNVYSIFISNCRKLKMTRMSLNWWVDK